MQKNFIVEVYEVDGNRTYIVREAVDQSNQWKPVVVTDDPAVIADFLDQVKVK